MKKIFQKIIIGLSLFLTACATPEPSAELLLTVDALNGQLASMQATVAVLSTQNYRQDQIISYLATHQFPITPFSGVITPTPWDMVSGVVVIADGKCCAGGFAGDTIAIPVEIFANSNEGTVTEMRLTTGSSPLTPANFEQVEWQLYTQSVELEIVLANNWVGYWVGVQFRDSFGNISDVYQDDISLEGMSSMRAGTLTPDPTP